jgi:hypothetical protein
MKFFLRIFFSLIVVWASSVGSLLSAATSIEIVNNLGVATPTTQFGFLEQGDYQLVLVNSLARSLS